LIVKINSKQEVSTWKAWDYLAKIITNHKLPGVPMLTLPKLKQIHMELLVDFQYLKRTCLHLKPLRR
jgi:hypothetical protein